MVLSLKKTAGWLLAAGAVLACIPKAQPVKSRQPLSVAVAAVQDREGGKGVDVLPDAATQKLTQALSERNLRARVASGDTVRNAFQSRRTTAHRLGVLAEAADGADLLLLVETEPRFYSALNGRYR